MFSQVEFVGHMWMAALVHSSRSTVHIPPPHPSKHEHEPEIESHDAVLAVAQLQVCVQLSPQKPSGHAEINKTFQ